MRKIVALFALIFIAFMIQCGNSSHPEAQTIGPQGPAGPAGPTGPQGPQGPAGSFLLPIVSQPPSYVSPISVPSQQTSVE